MKTNKLSLKLLKYEILNATSNLFTIIFGIAFPLFMSILFSFIFSSDVPPEVIPEINASIFITQIMIIPLATMFIGYAANYSQEIESGALQRFKLFGYRESTLLSAKMLANLIFLTGAIIIYSGAAFLILDIQMPKAAAFIALIVFMYLLAAVLLVLSHAIASFLRKFGATYGITMTLYFAFMTFGGMMGINASQFPTALQYICKALPMYYINTGFLEFWQTGSYNFLPLCLSLIGLGVVSFGLLLLSIRLNKKGNTKKTGEKTVPELNA